MADVVDYRGRRYAFKSQPGKPGYYLRRPRVPGTTKRGVEYLHRKVFEDEVGPIPPGWVVHHKDRNTRNNRPNNLEALPAGAHVLRHLEEDPGYQESFRAPVVREAQRVKCRVCGTPLERKATSGKGPICRPCSSREAEWKRTTERSCTYCGKLFMSRKGTLCSQRCVNLATRGGSTRVLPDRRGSA